MGSFPDIVGENNVPVRSRSAEGVYADRRH